MAYTTINKSTDHFNTKLYSGTGAIQTVSGVGFEPSWIWTKSRTNTGNHQITDQVRGLTKYIRTNATNAEDTKTNAVTAVNSDGFVLGADSSNDINASGQTYVSWNWKANGAGSSNSDGDTTATVSANTTSGFSMVYYNTGGSGTQSMGHGLGSAPELIITKPTQNTESWYVYSKTLTHSNILKLNATDASSSSGVYAYAPTDSVFSVSNSAIGGYNGVMSYCFKSIKGFSKFGSYTGNGSADGTFVYTGFKPAFTLIKRSAGGTESWYINDNKRSATGGTNPNHYYLLPNDSAAEGTSTSLKIDLLSNGFKIRNTDTSYNTSGSTYIYMAFAEAPLVGSNNVPANAR